MIKQLWIEPSGFCNLKCSMCGGNPRQKQFNQKSGYLSIKGFKYILDEFLKLSPELKKVDFRGTGEPLMNKEIVEMILYCKEKNILTGITTSGSLLNKNLNKKILKSGLDYLTLSIESIDKKTYERIRIGAKLEDVKKNIEDFIKQKKIINPKCQVVLNVVLQKENIKQIFDIIKYASKIYVNAICLLNLENNYRKEHNTLVENGKIYGLSYKRLVAEFKNWKEQAKDLNVKLFLPPIKAYKNKNCVFNYSAPIVTCDGFINPCCRMQEFKYKMGNIFKDELRNIWNSKKYKIFRNKKTHFCKFCLKYLDRFENMDWLKK